MRSTAVRTFAIGGSRRDCFQTGNRRGQHPSCSTPNRLLMRFRLRTLLILLAVGPVILTGLWCAYLTPPLDRSPYFGPLPSAIRPGLNIVGLVILASLPLVVVAARRLIYGQR